jgi:uncharacterized Fe-S cluster-containing protein
MDQPGIPVQTAHLAHSEDERPPLCPTCNKRLVILATQSARAESGEYIRQQLWGCPRGHATAVRRHGSFLPVEILAELVG